MIELTRAGRWDVPAIRWIYRRSFPRSERKPFSTITRMAREGTADLWAIRRKGKLLGFASTVNSPELILLDYFAVTKSCRGQGVGSAALRAFLSQYPDKGIFVEIESTSEASVNHGERESRKKFYVNCGLTPMGTEADVFGVRMELLGRDCYLDFADYQHFYREHYNPWAAEHIREVTL